MADASSVTSLNAPSPNAPSIPIPEVAAATAATPAQSNVRTESRLMASMDKRAPARGRIENRSMAFPLDPVRPSSPGNESYSAITENEFLTALDNPLSTFSIDVDTASYANVRRFIEQGQRPPADAVRIEEMVNYFPYNYAQPEGSDPFAANVEIADCPWDREHRLVRVGLKGREIAQNHRPASNLVFLIDVSGSMNEPAKLPLVKASLQLLVNKLTARDRIAIVVYAGSSGLVLRSTSITSANKAAVLETLDRLEAGGSTNGGEGIQLAYSVARENFIKGGTNRVILCTDGDFNVGVTSQGALVDLIKQEAKSGVFLSVFGFGSGNLKDSTMMNLADKGNGNYAYIDSLKEGRKVFVEQMSGTLVTIAKDVKIQIEFNPAKVGAYRLIGYEKRMLAKEDFNNDKKDAGEIGAGHTVTALYEVVPAGQPVKPAVDALKYQANPPVRSDVDERRSPSSDLLTLKIRYKQPDGATSKKLEFPIRDQGAKWESASGDFKFAASVAAFGMILRESQLRGDADYGLVLKLAREGKGEDEEGYRSEFIRLVKTAAEMGR
ncbi:MAG: hypothetical protein B9S32_15595 [Verrucomicrobia bacterium Tous-C9LFEB]|nr:MAG: hypothetical protein B9S32_15595 [Verrucomicrobia bacterium Tous-C9LFEB]